MARPRPPDEIERGLTASPQGEVMYVVVAQRGTIAAASALTARAENDHELQALRSLEPRERAVLIAIYEHKVLLTRHVKALFFASTRRAQERLRHLGALGLIKSFYPPQPRGAGKAPGHHVLTEAGAQVVAALQGVARSEIRFVVKDDEDLEQDSYLAHRIGVNEFFCALIEAGRRNDGHGLYKWVPERTVGTKVGWIRPDGHGLYLNPGGACDFYLEYDRGTETTRQLTAKLAGYLGVAREWAGQGMAHFPSVLIVVASHSRERLVSAALNDALARFKNKSGLAARSFFVATEELIAKRGVLGRVWAPLPNLDGRLSIVELPNRKGVDHDLSDCIGRRYTGESSHHGPPSRRPRFCSRDPARRWLRGDTPAGGGRLRRSDELCVVVDIVPALPEEADALRTRQLVAIRRLLEAVVTNRRAQGLSALGDNVNVQGTSTPAREETG